MLGTVNKTYPTLVKSTLPYSRPVLKQLHMAGEGLNHADCSRFKWMISKLKWTLGATRLSFSTSLIYAQS